MLTRISAETLAEQLGVVSQHRRLLGRLLEILQEEGVLRLLDDQWEVCRIPSVEEPIETWKALLAESSAYQAELTLLGRCGQKLALVLRGEVEPLQLVFPEGSLTTSEHLYQDSPSYRIYNLLVQKAIALALSQLPEGRTVRILEIGAGTGSMTSYVLPKLTRRRTEYVFTDVSQQFTISAEQKFGDYPFVKYQILDIEADIVAQGFQPHSFDLILASDALHATRDLRQTLENVKLLLASQGMLVLLELTNDLRLSDLTFGLLKGWWLFTDVELRCKQSWIYLAQWRDLLKDVGFTEVASIADTPGIDKYRFLKQRLHWTVPKLSTPKQCERWSDLMPIWSWELWLARDIVADNPLPWQKSIDKLTPGRVAQAIGGVLAAIATPTRPPKPRGKSPGWTPGKTRLRKNRYPIVKKTATPPRKEPSVAV